MIIALIYITLPSHIDHSPLGRRVKWLCSAALPQSASQILCYDVNLIVIEFTPMTYI